MQDLNRVMVATTMTLFAVYASVGPSSAQAIDAPVRFSTSSHSTETPSNYDPATDEALFLLVSINGREIGLIAEFALSRQSQRMSAKRAELEGIGIAAPRNLGPSVFLDQIPGFDFIYDVASQTLLITVQGPAQIPVEISAVPQRNIPETQAGYGLVLNYRARANLGNDLLSDGFQAKEAFVSLDLRAHTPLGVLTSTGALSFQGDDFGSPDLIRYDTYFTVSNPNRLMTMTVGDFATSGMAWTRPVRLGGVQVRRDFSLREDVVTSPLLSYSGTAAVPSSIEVYIDNVRAYSGAVGQGPFNLSDVPMITGDGEAIFKLRDAGGNEQVTKVPFFATQNLLSKGLLDFAVEFGRARKGFGAGNADYVGPEAGAVSLRYGLSDSLTIGGHAERFDSFWMAGLGLDTVLLDRAEVSLAGGASVYGHQRGQFVFGALRTKLAGIGVRFSTKRTFGDFHDLSSAMAMESLANDPLGTSFSRFAPVRAQDALSLTFPGLVDGGTVGMNLIHSERKDLSNTILSVLYTQPLPRWSASFRANAFKDISGDGTYGVSVGLSMPLGGAKFASINLGRDRQGRLDSIASLSRFADRKPGSFGYRVDLSRQNRAFGTTYQTSFGRADLALRDSGYGANASATFNGALVLAGGGLFASNRISDGFAVVDVGVPDVPVSLNNRDVARTGMFGRALVPDLRSYRTNKISINPLDLPIDSSIGASAMNVVPARRSGVTVDFGGKPNAAALIVLRDSAGKFLSPGADVSLQGARSSFVVGYDGEVWIEGLHSENRISVQTGDKTCSAEFAYAAQPGAQVYIDRIECE